MDRGYIKLWRCFLDSKIYCNEALKSLWLHCLLEANHQKQWVPIRTGRGISEIEILPGQCIFGRNSWAKKLKIKPTTIWDRMKKLQRLGYIGLKPDTHCTIVTIMKWETYQENPTGNPKPTLNQPLTNPKPTDTNNNDKNEKNEKNKEKDICVPNRILNNSKAKSKDHALKTKLIIPSVKEGTLRSALVAWVQHRKEIKKPLTQTQLNKQVAWLEEQPYPEKCIDQSITQGWQGLFELKADSSRQQGNNNKNQKTNWDNIKLDRSNQRY